MESVLNGSRQDLPHVRCVEDLDASELTYSNIDFHFHAGYERHPDTSMDDYLDFARMTGRLVLGVTDHFGYYFPGRDRGPRPYAGNLDGFLHFIADIDEASARFPMLRILKCPELSAASLDNHMPDEAAQASHFFLCEPPETGREQVGLNTTRRLDHIRKAADLRKATSRPVVLAHPFRAAVVRRLLKEPIEPSITRLESAPRGAFSEEELSDFFMFDLRCYADACTQEGIPVEINGATDSRIRRVNLTAPYRMMLAAYRLLLDCGVDLVPGSDVHAIRSNLGRDGFYVPWTTFETLGLSPQNSEFVRSLLWLDDHGQNGGPTEQGARGNTLIRN
jgi:hypothetical protein